MTGLGRYGTVALVTKEPGPLDKRIRLTEADILLIVSALRSRAAMCHGMRRHRIERLTARLSEGKSGNPKFRLGVLEQTHEEDLDEDELEG